LFLLQKLHHLHLQKNQEILVHFHHYYLVVDLLEEYFLFHLFHYYLHLHQNHLIYRLMLMEWDLMDLLDLLLLLHHLLM
jgi:hypothetical protein